MGRPTTKTDLIHAAESEFENLNNFIASMTETELTTPFHFDEKKKEAHWKRDKNLRDVIIHLYEWHQLLLQWVSDNQQGEHLALLPKPYNWKTYGAMNIALWEKPRFLTALAIALLILPTDAVPPYRSRAAKKRSHPPGCPCLPAP